MRCDESRSRSQINKHGNELLRSYLMALVAEETGMDPQQEKLANAVVNACEKFYGMIYKAWNAAPEKMKDHIQALASIVLDLWNLFIIACDTQKLQEAIKSNSASLMEFQKDKHIRDAGLDAGIPHLLKALATFLAWSNEKDREKVVEQHNHDNHS